MMKITSILSFILVGVLPVNPLYSSDLINCSSAKFNNRDFGITVMASRDTGPVTRMDASGLIVAINVFTHDLKPLPEAVNLSGATAVFDTQVWDMDSSDDRSVSRYFDGSGFSVIYGQGPPWPLDSSINIAFKVHLNDFVCEFSQQAVRIKKNK